MILDPDTCYRAVKSRDSRFDGRFFVSSTARTDHPDALSFELGYRPPYDWDSLLNFLAGRDSRSPGTARSR